MDVVDRVSATDRAVAAYRRFVETDSLDVVPDMISDLLHWHRIMLDNRLTLDTVKDMLHAAANAYEGDLVSFDLGGDPLIGNRRESAPPRTFAEALRERTPRASIPWHTPQEHNGSTCNCDDCIAQRDAIQDELEQASQLLAESFQSLPLPPTPAGFGFTTPPRRLIHFEPDSDTEIEEGPSYPL